MKDNLTDNFINKIEEIIDIDVNKLIHDSANNKYIKNIICTFSESKKHVHKNNKDISIDNLSITFHGKNIITDSELKLNFGQRYGLVGSNGCGKSVLMNTLGFNLLKIQDSIDIHLLTQEFPKTDLTALEAVKRSDDSKQRIENELEELTHALSEDPNNDDILKRIDELSLLLENEKNEANAAIILNGLGFDKEMQSKKTKEFSGGWRMRISLACALYKEPTLLLLDEPTNHLDMEAVIWLEN